MEQTCCCCGQEDVRKLITGCRFSLYPMDSQFVPLILGALEKTDTSAVWSQSDALSTVYRGKLPYVADAVRALFVNAYRPGVHMAMEGQLSRGCPGDIAGDMRLDREGVAPNEGAGDVHFPALCKFALYPMGVADYMPHIVKAVELAKDYGLETTSIYYATRVSGDIQDIFSYLQAVCAATEQNVSHYVIHFTLSVNSPTKEA